MIFRAADSGGHLMSETGVRGIDLFKIAGESISGWIPSWKTGNVRPTRQPFCSQMEEQLLLYLEYHPQVSWYGRGDISATFASTYKIASPLPIPFTINYLFEGKAHAYLPDAIGQLLDGRLLIAEAGLEQDKRRERNRAKAEAARKVAQQQGGVYWIGTEATLSRRRHANLIFLHARRQSFPAWQELKEALHVVWPAGEVACVHPRCTRRETTTRRARPSEGGYWAPARWAASGVRFRRPTAESGFSPPFSKKSSGPSTGCPQGCRHPRSPNPLPQGVPQTAN